MPAEFAPSTYVTLHEALARLGEALVNGWDGSEVSLQVPSENDAVHAAGNTWIDREYDERLWSVGLPRLCPPSAEAAERLAQAVEIVREWISAGRLRLQILGDEGYETVPLRAVLRDDATLLTGRYKGGGQIEPIAVLRAEINAALAEMPAGKLTTKGPPEHATAFETRTLSKKELEARYIARVKDLTAKGEKSSEGADWAFLKTLSPGIPRERMREIRRQHAPAGWTKSGAPGYK